MLTRNSLKALGIESEKIDAIIEGHVETVNGLKSEKENLQAQLDKVKDVYSERDKYKGDLEKAQERISALEELSAGEEGIVSERDQLKAQAEALKAENEKLTKERDEFSTENTSLREQMATFETEKATLTENATRAQEAYEQFKAQVETEKANNTKKGYVRDVLRNGGCVRPDFQDLIISAIDLTSVETVDNGIKDPDAFVANLQNKFPSCFGSIQEVGTPVVQPLVSNSNKKLTLADVKNMTADQINANWEEVQKVLAQGK